MRLIDADALIKVVNDDIDRCYLLGFGRISGAVGPLCHFVDEINDQPTIDAEPVVHARWVESEIPEEKYICSACGGACWYYDYKGVVAKSRYCPNCPAKMDAKEVPEDGKD